MSENTKNPAAQNKTDSVGEDSYKHGGETKEGSDWLGGPQNGNETSSTSTEGAYQSTAHSTGFTDQLGSADWLGGPQNGNKADSGSDYTKHRFDETRSGSDWLGGPQNGNEAPSEKKAPKGSLGEPQNYARNPQTGE